MSGSRHQAIGVAFTAALIAMSCELEPLCLVEPCRVVHVTLTVRGQVSTASMARSAVANALVSLQELGWPRAETRTDETGFYELSYRPTGCELNHVIPFVVVVTAPGYASDSSHNPARWSTIRCSDEPQTVDFLLNAAQPSFQHR